MVNIQSITPSQVKRAYKGKVGCMCGCRGQYWTPEQSMTMVTKVLRIIQANADLAEVDPGCEWIALQLNGKEHCVYFVD